MVMNLCDKEIQELLPLYIDNELNAQEKKRVEDHLQSCEHCKEELALYQIPYGEANS
jgi:anti-sigma factor RsiW